MKLKNYFQIGIGIGVMVALIGGIVWFKSGYSKPAAETEAQANDGDDAGPDANLDQDISDKEESAEAAAPETKKAPPVDAGKASEFFSQSLKQLSACIQVNANPTADKVDPTPDNLISAMRGDLGDPILRAQDFVVWNLHVNGEERRIRIETDYTDNDQASRHLMYFKVDSQGTPSLIPLAQEQTKDPSDTFIASLQKDGEVYQEDKGERAYFENGQEVILNETNGKIDDMEISNGNKTFHCKAMLSATADCKCY